MKAEKNTVENFILLLFLKIKGTIVLYFSEN